MFASTDSQIFQPDFELIKINSVFFTHIKLKSKLLIKRLPEQFI